MQNTYKPCFRGFKLFFFHAQLKFKLKRMTFFPLAMSIQLGDNENCLSTFSVNHITGFD